MPQLLKNNINLYNAVDYKVPILSHKNDFRTSVDRGNIVIVIEHFLIVLYYYIPGIFVAHSLWIGPPEQKIPVPSIPNYCNLYNIKECKNDVRSTYQEQHDWKVIENEILLSLDLIKFMFINTANDR